MTKQNSMIERTRLLDFNFKDEYYLSSLYFYVDRSKGTNVLLYAWIISASNADNDGKWFKKDVSGSIICYVGCLHKDITKQFWDEIKSGRKLRETINLISPDIDAKILASIVEWTMNSDEYVFRNKCIFATKSETRSSRKFFHSPSKKTIAEVESIFCLQKPIKDFDFQKVPSAAKDIRKEIGIDLLGTEIGRLGNVEFLSFPSGTIQDRSFVDVRTIKTLNGGVIECKEICVTIKADIKGSYDVNARLINGKAIILDQLKIIDTSIGNDSCRFNTNEDISEIQVKIWFLTKDGKTLWYEKSFSLIRSIGARFSIDGNRAIIGSRNIDRWKSEKRLIRNADEIATVKLGKQSEYSTINDNCLDKWTPAIRAIESHWSLRFPPKTSALFLPQGWDGQVAFYQWLKDFPNKHTNIHKLYMMDPYLEDEAIRFVPRFEHPEIKYVLITNTKATKDPEEAKTKIQKSANQIFTLLSGYDIEIYDVIKDRQIIHDRYLMAVDNDGLFIGGYNLSNSIQMANNTYPLLITEIPGEVAMQIQTWLSSILETGLQKVWDSKLIERPLNKPDIQTEEIIKDPALDQSEILRALSNGNVWEAWKKITRNAYNNAETNSNFENCASQIAIDTWSAVAEQISTSIKQSTCSVSPERKDESDFVQRFLFEKDFSNQLKLADDALNYLHDTYALPPEIFYFMEYSAGFSINSFIDCVKKIVEDINNGSGNTPLAFASIQKAIVSMRISLLFRGNNEGLYLESGDSLCVGIASASLIEKLIDEKTDFTTFYSKISAIKIDDQLEVLFRLTYEIRVRENRSQSNDDLQEARRQAFAKIIDLWPIGASSKFITHTIEICSGPSAGSWLSSTLKELLIPLIGIGKVNPTDIAESIKYLAENNLKYGSHFYGPSSTSIFESTAYFICHNNDVDYVEELTRESKKSLRILSHPFAESSAYDDYSNATEHLHKVLIILSLASCYETKMSGKLSDLIELIKGELIASGDFLDTNNSTLNDCCEKTLLLCQEAREAPSSPDNP